MNNKRFSAKGELKGIGIKPSEFTYFDGRRLDLLTISVELKNQEQINELIKFLEIHKHCFKK